MIRGNIKPDFVIKNISQLLTMDGENSDDLGIIKDAFVAIKDGKIAYIGTQTEADQKINYEGTKQINAAGKVVLPGFVDCHTHLVFGGSRVDEYSCKLTDSGVKKMKESGMKTGIYVSVDMTRSESEEKLFCSSIEKIENMIRTGTTSIEIKSGYGLDRETELKQLRVIKNISESLPINVYSTYLGAHGWPQDMDKADYIKFLVDEMIPYIAENKLADACDIWVDDGYYTAEEARVILGAAKKCGMDIKIHTDGYSYIGGSDLAAEMQMMSADHMNYVTDEAIAKLKAADIPCVVLPGTDFSVKHAKPFDARKLIDSGLTLALGTNLNPGNYFTSMQSIISLACRNHSMTVEEAIRAATYGSAKALKIEDKVGSLKVGMSADIQIWRTDNYKDVCYKHDINLAEMVIAKGKLVA